MKLKILLPYKLFYENASVIRVVLEGPHGFMGILPHRLDCVTPLVPSILTFELETREEVHMAIDEGIFTKCGEHLFISIRNAIRGKDLPSLKEAIEKDFSKRQGDEAQMKILLSKLESGFLGRLRTLNHDV